MNRQNICFAVLTLFCLIFNSFLFVYLSSSSSSFSFLPSSSLASYFSAHISDSPSTASRFPAEMSALAPSKSIFAIVEAASFAAEKHKNQRRKGKQQFPYINHPLRVAHLLTSIGGVDDPVAIQAAMLHDTVEDTDTTFKELEQLFGSEVKSVVAELTDDKDLPKLKRKELQILHSSHKSTRAKLVSLCDKIQNLESIVNFGAPENWTKDRIQNYAAWAFKVVKGYRGVNKNLEDFFDKITTSTFTLNDQQFPLLPANIESASLL